MTEGAIELSKNTSWTNLQTLILGINSIKPEGIVELSKNPGATWVNLEVLDLHGNYVQSEGIEEELNVEKSKDPNVIIRKVL
mgnify:CR=1 FL=1